MKLYYAPGACSLASHIALIESGLPFATEHVDLRSRITAGGADYRLINPKGYVPALELEDGDILTENLAILSYIAAESGWLSPPEGMGHWRVLETSAFIASEIHKSFKPLLDPAGDEATRQVARAVLATRFEVLAGQLGPNRCLFGDHPMIADCYLFVMLMWAREKAGVSVPPPLAAYYRRLKRHPSFARALREEGLAPA